MKSVHLTIAGLLFCVSGWSYPWNDSSRTTDKKIEFGYAKNLPKTYTDQFGSFQYSESKNIKKPQGAPSDLLGRFRNHLNPTPLNNNKATAKKPKAKQKFSAEHWQTDKLVEQKKKAKKRRRKYRRKKSKRRKKFQP